MTGFHSRIFHEPHDSSHRNRDLFPLPNFQEEGEIKGGVCRAVRRRIQGRSFVTQRTNLAISSLNSLFFGGDGRYESWSVDNVAELPQNQRESLVSIQQSVKAFGAPPPEACRSGALKALRTVSDGYSDPEPGIGAVCDMVLEQLSLPSGKVAGVDLASSLEEPLRAASYPAWIFGCSDGAGIGRWQRAFCFSPSDAVLRQCACAFNRSRCGRNAGGTSIWNLSIGNPGPGVDHDGIFLTLRAQPYPYALVDLVSKLVASTLRG